MVHDLDFLQGSSAHSVSADSLTHPIIAKEEGHIVSDIKRSKDG
jgi:hypothetical protein